MKTVSIIIPIFNGEHFIHRCFSNICKQTYEHSAIECIFVNDGSMDNSASLINELISSNTSNIIFRLISHSHNQGVSAARNTGIKEAKNEYLYFMDVDDTITENCIELLFHATIKYSEATVITGNLLNKKENTCHHTKLETIRQISYQKNLQDILLFIYTSYPVNKLVSRQFILENKLFFPVGIPYFEDLQWNIDVARLSQEIIYLPEITYYYEYVNSSAMSTSQKKQDTIAECYLSLINKAMTLHEPTCSIEIHLFICFYLMKLLKMKSTKIVTRQSLHNIRKNLFQQAFHLGKPLLVLYDLQLYQPFLTITKIPAIRNRSAELRLWVCKHCKSN